MFRSILIVQPRQTSQRLRHELKSSNVLPSCLPSARHFSRQHILETKPNESAQQQSSSQPSKPQQHAPNPGSDMKATLSFKELGATRTVKIVVIVAICILGTAETIFWVQVGWRKFFGGTKEDEQEAEIVEEK